MQTDRSLRSVFVGNIPYDATEEKLRDIFSAVGPVLSFRIVFDRETGKPKGYGFCEYKDQETATSAIRNLNGHDLGGRQLRVDSASNERARDEPDAPAVNENQVQQHQLQHHQPPPVAEPLLDSQTLINNVMCSLQPEQLFDIGKQLKSSLMINPNETRQLLIQNPQLSYAILQSLVMIKAIDAQTAMSTLYEPLIQPAQIQPAPLQPTQLGPQLPPPSLQSSMPMMAIPGTGIPGAMAGPGIGPGGIPQMASGPQMTGGPQIPGPPMPVGGIPAPVMPAAAMAGPAMPGQPSPITPATPMVVHPFAYVGAPSQQPAAPADPRLARYRTRNF